MLARRRQQQLELKQFVRRLTLLLVRRGGRRDRRVDRLLLCRDTRRSRTAFCGRSTSSRPWAACRRRTTPAPAMILAVLEILGIGTLFYGLATVAEFFVSGQLHGILDRRRTEKMMDSYSEHYIVCGYGRVGRQVARDLKAHSAQIVVIDHNPMHREAASVRWRHLHRGPCLRRRCPDPSRDRTRSRRDRLRRLRRREHLRRAQRPRAERKVQVIARASAEDAERKLMRAGANEVISPYKMTGTEMARVALAPTPAP